MAKRIHTPPTAQPTVQPTQSRVATAENTVIDSANVVAQSTAPPEMLFNRQNYTVMLAGLGLMLLGFLLMRGGAMPDANTWDESIIYSTTRITIAPMLILLGLGVEVYAIFRR